MNGDSTSLTRGNAFLNEPFNYERMILQQSMNTLISDCQYWFLLVALLLTDHDLLQQCSALSSANNACILLTRWTRTLISSGQRFRDSERMKNNIFRLKEIFHKCTEYHPFNIKFKGKWMIFSLHLSLISDHVFANVLHSEYGTPGTPGHQSIPDSQQYKWLQFVQFICLYLNPPGNSSLLSTPQHPTLADKMIFLF